MTSKEFGSVHLKRTCSSEDELTPINVNNEQRLRRLKSNQTNADPQTVVFKPESRSFKPGILIFIGFGRYIVRNSVD